MAAHKFLTQSSGNIVEEAAVASSSGAADDGKIPALNASGVLDATIINSKTTSAGAGDSGKIPALDGSGLLDSSFMPVGIGADTAAVAASENLAAGDYVNIYDSSGAKCRKADASAAGKEAHGFVLAVVTAPANATVYFEGTNTQVTGQTPGNVYLSPSTPGLGTATPPSGAGQVVQKLGVAVSATAVNVEIQQHIVLAS